MASHDSTRLDARFNYSYTYNPSRFGSRSHNYEIVGRDGALNFHVTQGRDGDFYGGLEEHRRVPPRGCDRPPDHVNCRLLGCPCWHDGTSLYASEVLIPRWQMQYPNHDDVFAWLIVEFDRRFKANDAE